MSFSRYRFIDLTTLIVIGIITEALGTYLSIRAIPYYNPYSVVALGLICLAITRYNAWGMICIPIFALTNILTYTLTYKYGLTNSDITFTTGYYVLRGLGTTLAMFSPCILLYYYRKGTNLYITGTGKVFGLSAIVGLIALLITIIFVIVTTAVTTKGSGVNFSVILYSVIYGLEYQAIGIIAMFLMNFIMYKQGTFQNSYEMFVERDYEKKNEYEYYNVKSKEDDLDDEKSDKKSDKEGM